MRGTLKGITVVVLITIMCGCSADVYTVKDDNMNEMYNYDRQVQRLQIQYEELNYKIQARRDELNGQYTTPTRRKAITMKIQEMEREKNLIKSDLHNAAQKAINFYNSMSADVKKEFNTLYHYDSRLSQLRSL